MSDRELLELAAKAIGRSYFDGCGQGWNPLEDDGDALRLAARLRLIVDLEDKEISFWSVRKQSYICISFDDDDDYRRTIVRAAAEIGRAMK